ncbi:MAG: ATPase central protein [Caulobacteraceae bacterium]|nr:ATPase central protein [Caulobacteraceae bacterium]
MVTQTQLISLFRSFAQGDDGRFRSLAMDLAADAGKRGHHRLADEIKTLMRTAGEGRGPASRSTDPIPVIKPRGELAGLVSANFPLTRLSDMVLEDGLRERLRRIVEEQRHRETLAQHSLKPRRKFLLVGPPGTGKTMTASALAGELSGPLYTILLDGVITKFMGESAAKLRLVFDAMQNGRGVYFFDEFDALASKRLTGNDVGEARRMLNSMLQFLDEDGSDALILAATNHPELLDPAVFRRFDGTIEYHLPSGGDARRVFEKALFAFDLGAVNWTVVEGESAGLSQADMVRAAEDAARTAVLENDALFTTAIVVAALGDRRHYPTYNTK